MNTMLGRGRRPHLCEQCCNWVAVDARRAALAADEVPQGAHAGLLTLKVGLLTGSRYYRRPCMLRVGEGRCLRWPATASLVILFIRIGTS